VGRRSIIVQGMEALIEFLENEKNSDPFMKMQEYKKLEKLGHDGFGEVYHYHNDCLDMI